MVGDHVRGAPLCKLRAHPRSALDPASFLEAILTLMEVSGSSILQLWQQFHPLCQAGDCTRASTVP